MNGQASKPSDSWPGTDWIQNGRRVSWTSM